MMNTASDHWFKQVHELWREASAIPLYGNIPAPDLDKISQALTKLFAPTAINLSTLPPKWLDPQQCKEKIQGHSNFFLTLPPHQGAIIWSMPASEKQRLSLSLLSAQKIPLDKSSDLTEGFYQYLLLEGLDVIGHCQASQELLPSITTEISIEEPFCIFDVNIKIDELSLWASVAISSSLLQSLKTFYSTKPIDKHTLNKNLQAELPLHITIGHTQLTALQYQTLKQGDFLLLDTCSYDPTLKKGTAQAFLDQTLVFHGKLKNSTLKVQDFAHYHEDTTFMQGQPPQQEPSFNDDAFSENEELLPSSEEEPIEEIPSEEEPLWAAEEPSSKAEELLTAKTDIPINIVVEVERLAITLDKLLSLAPGNILELSKTPEQGVALTVGGKKIARAELIKIGDVFGVKILSMAD
jgi:flagellar motor switch protein FliN/FliY